MKVVIIDDGGDDDSDADVKDDGEDSDGDGGTDGDDNGDGGSGDDDSDDVDGVDSDKLYKHGDNIQPTYSFPDLEPVCCSMSGYNCCFLTCIQVSQEAG